MILSQMQPLRQIITILAILFCSERPFLAESYLCRDLDCSQPISISRSFRDYKPSIPNHLELERDAKVRIFIKEAGINEFGDEIWYGESRGRKGFFPKHLVGEYISLAQELIKLESIQVEQPDTDSSNVPSHEETQTSDETPHTELDDGQNQILQPEATKSDDNTEHIDDASDFHSNNIFESSEVPLESENEASQDGNENEASQDGSENEVSQDSNDQDQSIGDNDNSPQTDEINPSNDQHEQNNQPDTLTQESSDSSDQHSQKLDEIQSWSDQSDSDREQYVDDPIDSEFNEYIEDDLQYDWNDQRQEQIKDEENENFNEPQLSIDAEEEFDDNSEPHFVSESNFEENIINEKYAKEQNEQSQNDEDNTSEELHLINGEDTTNEDKDFQEVSTSIKGDSADDEQLLPSVEKDQGYNSPAYDTGDDDDESQYVKSNPDQTNVDSSQNVDNTQEFLEVAKVDTSDDFSQEDSNFMQNKPPSEIPEENQSFSERDDDDTNMDESNFYDILSETQPTDSIIDPDSFDAINSAEELVKMGFTLEKAEELFLKLQNEHDKQNQLLDAKMQKSNEESQLHQIQLEKQITRELQQEQLMKQSRISEDTTTSNEISQPEEKTTKDNTQELPPTNIISPTTELDDNSSTFEQIMTIQYIHPLLIKILPNQASLITQYIQHHGLSLMVYVLVTPLIIAFLYLSKRRAKSVVAKTRTQLSKYSKQLETKVSELEKEKRQLSDDINTLKAANTNTVRILDENQLIQRKLEGTMNELEAYKQSCNSLQNKINDYEGECGTLRAIIEEKSTQLERSELIGNSAQDEIVKLRFKNDSCQEEISQSKGDKDGLLLRLEANLDTLNDVKAKLSESDNDKIKLIDLKYNLENELEEKNNNLISKTEEITKLNGDINVLTRNITKFISLNKNETNVNSEGNIADIKAEMIATLTNTTRAISELERITALNDNYETENSQLVTRNTYLTSKCEELEDELSSVKSDNIILNKKCVEIDTKHQVLNEYFKAKEQELHKQLNDAKHSQVVLQGKDDLSIQQLDSVKAERRELKEELNNLKLHSAVREKSFMEQISLYEKRAQENISQIRRYEQELRGTNREITELKKKLSESAIPLSLHHSFDNSSQLGYTRTSSPRSLSPGSQISTSSDPEIQALDMLENRRSTVSPKTLPNFSDSSNKIEYPTASYPNQSPFPGQAYPHQGAHPPPGYFPYPMVQPIFIPPHQLMRGQSLPIKKQVMNNNPDIRLQMPQYNNNNANMPTQGILIPPMQQKFTTNRMPMGSMTSTMTQANLSAIPTTSMIPLTADYNSTPPMLSLPVMMTTSNNLTSMDTSLGNLPPILTSTEIRTAPTITNIDFQTNEQDNLTPVVTEPTQSFSRSNLYQPSPPTIAGSDNYSLDLQLDNTSNSGPGLFELTKQPNHGFSSVSQVETNASKFEV